MKLKAPKRLIALCLLALCGLGLSLSLSQHFYQVRSGTAAFQSYCNISATVSCDLVAASRFAEIIPGVPLANLGIGWFLALFFVGLIATNPFWHREGLRAAFALTAIGSLAQLVSLIIMAWVIKSFCLQCLGVDLIIFLSFIIVVSLRPEGFAQHKPDRSKWKVLGMTIGISLLAGTLGGRAMDVPSGYEEQEMKNRAQAILNSPVLPIDTTSDSPVLGTRGAPITIVEFSDFQCPFCKVGALRLNGLLKRYPGKIQILFKNYPLDASCNRKMQQSLHAVACEAARGALCAMKQGQFEKAYEALFENQETLPSVGILATLSRAGLNTQELQACLVAPHITTQIAKDLEEGDRLGVQSTPTFFINGHRVEGAFPMSVWTQMVDALLKG